MGLEEQLRSAIDVALDGLVADGVISEDAARSVQFNVEPPRRGGSGHLATNVALVLAKNATSKPRDLAERLRCQLGPLVTHAEVAGPGFLNITLAPEAFQRILEEISSRGAAYGRGPAASGERVNMEFVSANPTGPLLISHSRGAVVGDAVARLLEAAGLRVTREYYINDFGNQVRLLADSVAAAHAGQEPPEGGYGGFYVEDLARYVAQARPELLESDERSALLRYCVTLMLDGIPGSELLGIRDTLRALGVDFDVWTSEEGLHRWGRVDRALSRLGDAGRLAERDGATVFVTGDEDEKDRVIRKSDGVFTYFASDIAYHDDKLARGFQHLINVWGADHHGYIARMKSSLAALGHDPESLEVLLIQMVALMRGGKTVKMGKRLGNLITIQEVLEEIDHEVGNPNAGRDAVRFFFLSRRAEAQVTLDVDLAKKQESDNPVFYIQYGHARLCAIQRRAQEVFGIAVPHYNPRLIPLVTHPLELQILAKLGRFPNLIREAAAAREPHKLVGFLTDIAQSFQSYYTQLKAEGDPILPLAKQMTEGWEERWDKDKTLGRLLWVEAVRSVYAAGLELLGISAPERMLRARDDEDTTQES